MLPNGGQQSASPPNEPGESALLHLHLVGVCSSLAATSAASTHVVIGEMSGPEAKHLRIGIFKTWWQEMPSRRNVQSQVPSQSTIAANCADWQQSLAHKYQVAKHANHASPHQCKQEMP
jgi:hypothetical protein